MTNKNENKIVNEYNYYINNHTSVRSFFLEYIQ